MPVKSKRNGKAGIRTAKPPLPAVRPNGINTPVSLNDTLSLTLPAGVVSAFIFLGYHPKKDQRLEEMLCAYRALPQDQWNTVNIEALCAEHGIQAWEFLEWLTGAVVSMGGNAVRLLENAMKFPITKASLERAMHDPGEAGKWLQSWGQHPVPMKSQIIVNASSNAQAVAAASAVERGLPSFGETTEEADALLRNEPLELAEAEPLDVPFTVEKEPAYLNKEQPNVHDSNPNP